MAVPLEVLSQIACVRKLSSSSLAHVSQQATIIAAKSGDVFFEQGDAPTGLHMLLSGRVKLYRKSKERFQILALPSAGQCFGAETLSTDMPSLCSASAMKPTRTIYISPDTSRMLLNEHPDFQELLLELVTARLKQYVALVHDLAFRDVTARLAAVLVAQVAEEGRESQDGIRIDRLLSQQEFASFVGTAREVIYRTFRKLERDKILRLTANEIYILDLRRLSELALQETR